MKHLVNIEEFIIEKSIGSESIRMKHYSDLPKHVFYSIVNLDPTSVRKKDFSKPGKYVKWLIKQYLKEPSRSDMYYNDNLNALQRILINKNHKKELNKYLFIFSTEWYKNKSKKSMFHIGGETTRPMKNDIFRFKTLKDFTDAIEKVESEFEKETEDAKFEVIHSDDKIDVLIPINFTASYEISKNTEWCSQSYSGFSLWNKRSILFRIVPKDKKYDIVKITWNRESDSDWQIAGPKYPEVSGRGNPFRIVDNDIEKWEHEIRNWNHKYPDYSSHFDNVIKTMSLLNDNVKKKIVQFHNKIATKS
jgi:hypothetical protein